MSAKTLLVTGASGKLGQAVLEELLVRGGGHHLIATTRNPASLASFAARGVEVREADFDMRLDALAQAFQGADRLLIVSTNALDRPGHRGEQQLRAVAAAVKAGVGHVLYTSVVNAPAGKIRLSEEHVATETALAESAAGYTFLRNNWYVENLEGDLRYALSAGSLSMAIGEGKVGFVHRADCARAAAGALLDGFEGRRILDITGPESLSLADLAASLSRVSGKTIVAAPLPPEVRKGILQSVGLPPALAELLADSEGAMAHGWLDSAPGSVESLSGRAPASVESYLKTLVA